MTAPALWSRALLSCLRKRQDLHDGHFSIFAFCPARHACNDASLSLCTSKTVQLRYLIQSVSIIAVCRVHRSEWDSVRIDWLTYAFYPPQHTPANSATAASWTVFDGTKWNQFNGILLTWARCLKSFNQSETNAAHRPTAKAITSGLCRGVLPLSVPPLIKAGSKWRNWIK